MAKKKKKTTKKKATRKTEMLVVQSKFKEALKSHQVNVAADAIQGANEILAWYLSQAAARAKANGRKTVRAHDFIVN